jgi:hypothetical protein
MSVGQAPVTTFERTNPDVAICWDTLMEVSREVQSEGWTFNREYDYPMVPNADKHIEYPNNALQIDISKNAYYYNGGKYDTVRKNNRLYDRRSHTDEWDETIYCDIKWMYPLEDLPIPIQQYIIAKACAVTSSRLVGDPNQYQILQQKEAYTRAMAIEYEAEQGDYNMFRTPRDEDHYIAYQPFKTLQRY